eukprot:CAMPEP_0177774912 /NCGR_PEP_ID=MMETSP0491_2-20121128/13791_1 /TAXON_ID=63592 /ORGANISM="Tetraselmis chuii, Strain PLY429" /LENGTH=509 /DNA_ID=CAMNT_0019293385 /DNA_START=171 /DNA_END=1701 /DNA_ORIENTATION=+
MLSVAIEEAVSEHRRLRERQGLCRGWSWGELLQEDEATLLGAMSEDFENFYSADALQPYIPLAGRGPWVVTTHGAVIHDNGGYGMLGLGQNPPTVLDALSKKQVMANIMTPSLSQAAFGEAMRREVGHTRPEQGAPHYHKFVCLNSGSEAVSFALRVADIHAKQQTQCDGPHAGRRSVFLSLKVITVVSLDTHVTAVDEELVALMVACWQGSFHGRTDGPAHASDSCRKMYASHLNSFHQREKSTPELPPFTVTVEPNDVVDLHDVFGWVEEEGLHIQAMLFEPVMGEGNPGVAITRRFYDEARRLTRAHHSLLLIDSVQAGLRAQGTLSIVDYPDFQDCDPPDFETWSKAINAGQFPLSIVALSSTASAAYVKGLYGNSMTANPRALVVAVAVLEQVTPALRNNIRERGAQLKAAFQSMQVELPRLVRGVTGTGLLVAMHLEDEVPVVGAGGLEEECRRAGLGVIHGGKNALRFTPWFGITSEEVDLVVRTLRNVLIARASTAASQSP